MYSRKSPSLYFLCSFCTPGFHLDWIIFVGFSVSLVSRCNWLFGVFVLVLVLVLVPASSIELIEWLSIATWTLLWMLVPVFRLFRDFFFGTGVVDRFRGGISLFRNDARVWRTIDRVCRVSLISARIVKNVQKNTKEILLNWYRQTQLRIWKEKWMFISCIEAEI